MFDSLEQLGEDCEIQEVAEGLDDSYIYVDDEEDVESFGCLLFATHNPFILTHPEISDLLTW